jgi:hypothetical protein
MTVKLMTIVKRAETSFGNVPFAPDRSSKAAFMGACNQTFADLSHFCSQVLADPSYLRLAELFGYDKGEVTFTPEEQAIHRADSLEDVQEHFRPGSTEKYEEIKSRIEDKLAKREKEMLWQANLAADYFAYEDPVPGILLISAAMLKEDIKRADGMDLLENGNSYFEEWYDLKPGDITKRAKVVREKHM